MATLLAIIQDAAAEIGIEQPSSVISNSDTDVVRLLAMSNREGRSLSRDYNWTVQQKLHTFTTVDSQAEYALPTDYARLIRDTEWDRSNTQPIWGPLTPQEWQVIKSGDLGSGVFGRRYRIYKSDSSNAKTFRIDPTPDADDDNETLAFEYMSTYWCASSGGTGQSEWAADTDVSILDSDLLTLGLIVRYKRSVGLEFGSEADEYGRLLDQLAAQDRPAPTLSLTPSMRYRFLGESNMPDTGYGS